MPEGLRPLRSTAPRLAGPRRTFVEGAPWRPLSFAVNSHFKPVWVPYLVLMKKFQLIILWWLENSVKVLFVTGSSCQAWPKPKWQFAKNQGALRQA